ncbi:MAG: hypothetical protein GC192_24370 [Bacteroidetes bacterium]|nr:hypothetical protein [Bacteroidota bacterium]
MKQSKLPFLTLLFSAVLLFNACKKDEKSKTELLTANCWVATAIIVDPPISINGTTISDLYAQSDACDKDDIFCFKSNGTFTNEEGATKCDDADPQVIETGTWTFNQGETVVSVSSNGDISEVEIVELKQKSFKFKVLFEDFGGVKYYATYTTVPN